MATTPRGIPLLADTDPMPDFDVAYNAQSTALDTALDTLESDIHDDDSVATIAALPGTGNWPGRVLLVQEDDRLRVWDSTWRTVGPLTDSGTVSSVTSAGGIITVSHGLGTAAFQVTIGDNGSVGAAPETRLVKVNAKSTTQIQFIVYNGGSPFGSNLVGFDWQAVAQ